MTLKKLRGERSGQHLKILKSRAGEPHNFFAAPASAFSEVAPAPTLAPRGSGSLALL